MSPSSCIKTIFYEASTVTFEVQQQLHFHGFNSYEKVKTHFSWQLQEATGDIEKLHKTKIKKMEVILHFYGKINKHKKATMKSKKNCIFPNVQGMCKWNDAVS